MWKRWLGELKILYDSDVSFWRRQWHGMDATVMMNLWPSHCKPVWGSNDLQVLGKWSLPFLVAETLLCLAVQLTRPLNSGWRIWHGVRLFSYGSCIGSLVVTCDWSAQPNHLPWQLANKYNRSMSWACLGLAGRTKHSLFNSSLWMDPSASSYELCLPLLYCCTRIYHIIYTRSCVHVQQDGQLPSFLCDEVPLVCTATTPNRKSSLLVEKSYR